MSVNFIKSLAQSESRKIKRLFVIPAKAGIQGSKALTVTLDPRFRGVDR